MDLTKITTPFGLLDAETQAALKAHGGPYEYFAASGAWLVVSYPTLLWVHSVTYRVKPQPLTKPSVDWSVFGPEVVAIARDSSGLAGAFLNKPDLGAIAWGSWDASQKYCRLDGFIASYTPGTCDWRDSLVERPEGV